MFNRDYFLRYLKKGKFFSKIKKFQNKYIYFSFWVKFILKKIKSEGRLLDVGCGLGFFLRRIIQEEKATIETFGLDISEFALKEIRKAIGKENIVLVCASAEMIPFKNQSFDCITAFDLVEHLKNPNLFFCEARRVLQYNGILIITTPNVNSFGARIKGTNPDFKGKPYEERIFESHIFRDETHINLKNEEEWLKILSRNGFKIIAKGSDCLWDLPYFKRIPIILQKIFFLPLNLLFQFFVGFVNWKKGENLVFVSKKVK